MTANLSGVSPDCIRAWERRYSAVTPQRDNGRRVFGESDILRLQMLRELSARGNSISKVAKLNDEELAGMCEAFGIKVPDRIMTGPVSPEELARTTDMLMMSLESGRYDIFSHELDKCSSKQEIVPQILAKLRSMSGAGKLPSHDHLMLLEMVASIMAKAVAR